MKINWIVRLNNKTFWCLLIPAVLLLIQTVADVFGLVLDLGEIGNKLLAVVEAAFALVAVFGVIVDPTTKGTADSAQAMTYDVPKESAE